MMKHIKHNTHKLYIPSLLINLPQNVKLLLKKQTKTKVVKFTQWISGHRKKKRKEGNIVKYRVSLK